MFFISMSLCHLEAAVHVIVYIIFKSHSVQPSIPLHGTVDNAPQLPGLFPSVDMSLLY